MHRTGFQCKARTVTQQLWAPFTKDVNLSSYDLSKYGFPETLRTLIHEPVFTCQVNGFVGPAAVLEDFFHVLLCGFDVKDVRIGDIHHQPPPPLNGSFVAQGSFKIAHSRPLLGWKPSHITNAATDMPLTLDIPFHMRGEFCADHHEAKLNHLTFKAPLTQCLRDCRDVPRNVVETLESTEALKMLVTLRRARVRPDIITDRALRSASRKQDTWCSALGML